MKHPLLKLCGNHSADDTRVSFASNADYVGFVFAQGKRQVSNEMVRNWLQNEAKPHQKLVALFVNDDAEAIVNSIKQIPFDIIQCHGNEEPELVTEIKERTGLPVWKVIHHSDDAITNMRRYSEIADGYVVDCKVGSKWGGTGTSFDWSYVPTYVEEGRRQGVPVFIAGGIRPDNVDELLMYKPAGIDVSSGIEVDGKKSEKLVRELEERMGRDASR